MTPRRDPAPVRVYRRLTAIYPPAFRQMFAESMAADFGDAWHDARQSGRAGDVARLLASVGLDLAWSISCQWLRTSVPWLTAAYAAAIACVVEGLASAMLGGPFNPGVVAALLPLVSVITFTCWFLVPQMRHQRNRPTCLKSAI